MKSLQVILSFLNMIGLFFCGIFFRKWREEKQKNVQANAILENAKKFNKLKAARSTDSLATIRDRLQEFDRKE